MHGPGGGGVGAWSGGVCMVLGEGGAWSQGGVSGGDPPSGRLLLRAVHILLECILVLYMDLLSKSTHYFCAQFCF